MDARTPEVEAVYAYPVPPPGPPRMSEAAPAEHLVQCASCLDDIRRGLRVSLENCLDACAAIRDQCQDELRRGVAYSLSQCIAIEEVLVNKLTRGIETSLGQARGVLVDTLGRINPTAPPAVVSPVPVGSGLGIGPAILPAAPVQWITGNQAVPPGWEFAHDAAGQLIVDYPQDPNSPDSASPVYQIRPAGGWYSPPPIGGQGGGPFPVVNPVQTAYLTASTAPPGPPHRPDGFPSPPPASMPRPPTSLTGPPAAFGGVTPPGTPPRPPSGPPGSSLATVPPAGPGGSIVVAGYDETAHDAPLSTIGPAGVCCPTQDLWCGMQNELAWSDSSCASAVAFRQRRLNFLGRYAQELVAMNSLSELTRRSVPTAWFTANDVIPLPPPRMETDDEPAFRDSIRGAPGQLPGKPVGRNGRGPQ